MRLGMGGRPPGDERDTADDRQHTGDTLRPDRFVEDARADRKEEEQADREQRLHENEGRQRERVDLRPDADRAEQLPQQPPRSAQQPPQKRHPKIESLGAFCASSACSAKPRLNKADAASAAAAPTKNIPGRYHASPLRSGASGVPRFPKRHRDACPDKNRTCARGSGSWPDHSDVVRVRSVPRLRF